MTYTIVTDPQPDAPGGARYDAVIAVVGCGGTGGFLADAVCRLLLGKRAAVFLIDHDRVEPHNVARQAFDREDVGRFKAEVLAERLSRRYHRSIGYSVVPFDWEQHGRIWTSLATRLPLVIGCVDNARARSALAEAMRDAHPEPIDYAYRSAPGHPWWLDLGNERNSGQALLGNLVTAERLAHSFQFQARTATALPAPSAQRPDLLAAPPRREPEADCAERIDAGDQSATINQAMAALGAAFVERLLAGTCTWMQAMLNMDDGLLVTTPPDPKRVAAITGIHVNKLVYRYDEAERITREADVERGTLARSFGLDAEHDEEATAAHRRVERAALAQAVALAPAEERADPAFLAALEQAEHDAGVDGWSSDRLDARAAAT